VHSALPALLYHAQYHQCPTASPALLHCAQLHHCVPLHHLHCSTVLSSITVLHCFACTALLCSPPSLCSTASPALLHCAQLHHCASLHHLHYSTVLYSVIVFHCITCTALLCSTPSLCFTASPALLHCPQSSGLKLRPQQGPQESAPAGAPCLAGSALRWSRVRRLAVALVPESLV